MKQINNNIFYRIGRLHAITKLIISISVAIIVLAIVPNDPVYHINIMESWDAFGLTMILLSWISFFVINSQGIRQQSIQQDESAPVIFALVLVATMASLGEVFLLLTCKTDYSKIAIAISGMLLSWILIHTIFALRYAHLYYGNDKTNKDVHAGGLNFPEDKHPDYLDFAYFSFVLGMTFQVSDVEVTSKRLRRLSLLHGLISFFFNTLIVALTINVIAGIRK